MNCPNCGATIEPGQIKCFKCGSAVQQAAPQTAPQMQQAQPQQTGSFSQATSVEDAPKDWLIALILCFFVGYLGIHRFYTGSVGIGIIQLFTFGGCGVWTLIDFILILTGSYRDNKGRPLVRK